MQRQKKLRDEMKLRTQIVKQAYFDHHAIAVERTKEDKRAQRLKERYLQQVVKKQTRKHILDTLEQESKQWISNTDSIENLTGTIIPNVFHKQSDYFIKLQEVS